MAIAGASLTSQSADPDALKAAFLYNFVKFTEWPTDVANAPQPITACIASPEVASALQQILRDRPASSRAITLRWLGTGQTAVGCDLLYVSGVDRHRFSVWLAHTKETPVLTIGDGPAFVDAGGIIYFFVESGRMRFAVNLAAATDAKLRLSSQLLSLAKMVKDERSRTHDQTPR